MTKFDRVNTKIHRVCAGGLLLSMIPAGYASFTGDAESPLVYLPLLFLFPSPPILTGTYQLVAPWVRRSHHRIASRGEGA